MNTIPFIARNSIRYLKIAQILPCLLVPKIIYQHNVDIVRHRRAKHWNPKFKWLRTKKVIKIDIPNLQEKPGDLSPEEVRSRMKERGILPPRPWIDRPFTISCTSGIFEAYVPPEGDGKKSIISKLGAKQKIEFFEKKSKSMMAIRKIRNYEDDFDTKLFAQQAQDIYIKAHEALKERDKYKLREFVTERAYPEMMHNTKYTTIHWKFLQSLEPPRIVHARQTNMITKDNIFAQITIRFHTQQLLAIYDRFGRLMHGSEILAKDVLEYVVFEKNISNEYGIWRLHDKIVPDWLPSKAPSIRTYRVPNSDENQTESTVEEVNPVTDKEIQETVSTTPTPALA